MIRMAYRDMRFRTFTAVAWYAVFGVAWMTLSDRAFLWWSGGDTEALLRWHGIKEVLFVVVSALLLYAMVRRTCRMGERHCQAIFEGVGDALVMQDCETGQIVDANERALTLLKTSRERLREADLEDLCEGTPPFSAKEARAWLQSACAGGSPTFEWLARIGDGSSQWQEVNLRQASLPGRKVVLATLRDISRRKRAELALQHSERNLNRAQAVAGVGSWLLDAASGRLSCSAETYRMFALAPHQPLVLDDFIVRAHPDDRDRIRAAWQRALQGEGFELEHRIVVDGTIKWVRVLADLVRDAEGRLVEALGTVQDITTRWELEETRRQLLNHLDTVTGASPAMFWTTGLDGGADWFNQTWLKFTGRTLAQERGNGWLDGVHPDDVDAAVSAYREAFRARDAFSMEYRLRRCDGVYCWVLNQGMPRYDADGEFMGFIGSCLEITVEKEIAQALAESEERLRLAMQAGRLGIYDIDLIHWTAIVSAEYCLMLGYQPGELNADRETSLARLHPDDRDRVARALDDYVSGRIDDYRIEFRQQTRDGGWKWVLSIGRIWEWLPDGRPSRMVGSLIDIDERRQAETALKRMNTELEARVAERTAQLQAVNRELESFSYSVSHDLKAPLRGIDGYSQILLEDYGPKLDDEGRQFLRNIRNGVARMHALIEDMLAYSRMECQPFERQPMVLDGFVRLVVEGCRPEAEREGIVVTVDIAATETVSADRDGLALVLRNLLENAIKFTQGREHKDIRIGAQHTDAGVLLSVADSGIGFDMKYHDRIFEMFQRLHRLEDYPGTGVGLALVKKAVTRMGGRVWAESVPGEGATFYVELPA